MEHKFNSPPTTLNLTLLRDFCRSKGEAVTYRRGMQMEREGEPARWFAFVESGCFKYTTRGISDGHKHATWFSFEGEFVSNYPQSLYGQPAQVTIEAMVNSRVRRVSGEQLMELFFQNMETMELRSRIGEHLLRQMNARYLDFHRTTPRERYELLLSRCPGIMDYLPLSAIASFLNITPKTISMIRRKVTFGK